MLLVLHWKELVKEMIVTSKCKSKLPDQISSWAFPWIFHKKKESLIWIICKFWFGRPNYCFKSRWHRPGSSYIFDATLRPYHTSLELPNLQLSWKFKIRAKCGKIFWKYRNFYLLQGHWPQVTPQTLVSWCLGDCKWWWTHCTLCSPVQIRITNTGMNLETF